MQSELELKRENSLEKKKIEVFLASQERTALHGVWKWSERERKELFCVAAITKTSRRIRNDFLGDRKSFLGRLQPGRSEPFR